MELLKARLQAGRRLNDAGASLNCDQPWSPCADGPFCRDACWQYTMYMSVLCFSTASIQTSRSMMHDCFDAAGLLLAQPGLCRGAGRTKQLMLTALQPTHRRLTVWLPFF